MVYALPIKKTIVSKTPLKTKRTIGDHAKKVAALLQNNTVVAGRTSTGEPFMELRRNSRKN